MPRTSHQLARELLALEDLPVGVNYDGEFNGEPREPAICELEGKRYVIFDAFGPELPVFSGPYLPYESVKDDS